MHAAGVILLFSLNNPWRSTCIYLKPGTYVFARYLFHVLTNFPRIKREVGDIKDSVQSVPGVSVSGFIFLSVPPSERVFFL